MLQSVPTWIYPAPGVAITPQTALQSETRHVYTIRGVPPAQHGQTPITLFMNAVNQAVQMVEARWATGQPPYTIIWTPQTRIRSEIQCGAMTLHTNYIRFNNRLNDFTDALNNRPSFDMNYFQSHSPITVRLTINRFARNEARTTRGMAGAVRRRWGSRLSFSPVKFKQKLFHDRSMEGYFYQTNAVMQVPAMESNLCFPMAFLKSQLRRLFWNEGVQESVPQSTVEAFETENPWVLGSEFDSADCPLQRLFATPSDFFSGTRFCAFNGYKEKRDDGEGYAETTAAYNRNWEWAAMDMHAQVTRRYGTLVEGVRVLDAQVEEEVCMAYSKFFQVHIHLYNLYGEGNRYITYVDPTVKQYKRHVHLLVQLRPLENMDHCVAITSVRSFIVGHEISVTAHNFCDLCTLTYNPKIGDAKKHVQQCETCNPLFVNRKLKQCEEWLQKSASPFKETWFCTCYMCKTRLFHYERSSFCKANHKNSTSWRRVYECNACGIGMLPEEVGQHMCFIHAAKIDVPLEESQIWVYDIEAQQNAIGEVVQGDRDTPLDIYQHEVILVCLRRVYPDAAGVIVKHEFTELEAFCDFIYQSPIMNNSVILAHNGGGYDHQYVLTYIEKHVISHEIIPHAANKHRFIALTMMGPTNEPRRFLDFMAFVPGSLKNIGKDFGLTLAKGDFPHVGSFCFVFFPFLPFFLEL